MDAKGNIKISDFGLSALPQHLGVGSLALLLYCECKLDLSTNIIILFHAREMDFYILPVVVLTMLHLRYD